MRLRYGQLWKSVMASGLLAMLLLAGTPAWMATTAEAKSTVAPQRGTAATIAVFDFKEAPLAEVLKVFTELTSQNVVATPDIQGLGISLYLEKVTAMSALETLCKNYNLWYAQEGNIVRVMKVEEYGRELVLRRDEKVRLFNLRYASCLAVADMVARIYGDRVNYDAPKELESYGHVGTDEFPEIGEELDVEAGAGGSGSRTRQQRGGAKRRPFA